MQKSRAILLSAVALLSATVGGCFHPEQSKNPAPLPPPISLEEQLRLLNNRAEALPRLSAHLDSAEFYYQQNGKKEHQHCDGSILRVQQHPDTGDADVFLRVTLLDQLVFSAGKNQTQWWIEHGGDKKGAIVGDVHRDILLPDDTGRPNPLSIFRADLVSDLLAISPVRAAPDELLTMNVDDATAANEVLTARPDNNGHAVIIQKIIVDRFTGYVREVDLFDSAGQLAVRTKLTDYETVEDAHGKDGPVKVATEAQLDFPTQNLSAHFSLSNLKVPEKLNPAMFELPDFEKEGVKIEQAQ